METLNMSLWVLVTLVAVALLFDFMNGFHDAANSIATIVSTRVLKPHHAVLWAAAFNFLAYFIFQLKVASTIGKGTIDPSIVDHYVIFGALVGAISWNIITWYYGIPSSSSHALVGGLVGAAVSKAGVDSLITAGVLKIIAFIFVAPFLGFMIGGLLRSNASNSLSKAPVLGDLPILGALFRSSSFRRAESELVIIVTPYLVRPVNGRLSTPVDGWRAPHEGTAVLEGQTFSGVSGPRPVAAPARPGVSVEAGGAAAAAGQVPAPSSPAPAPGFKL